MRMDQTLERVKRVKYAAHRLERVLEQRALRFLGAGSMLLAVFLCAAMIRLTGNISGAVQGLHGATLLTESAGGYVLVGVAAFTAAVVLTILCMRLHERDKRNGEKREENT